MALLTWWTSKGPASNTTGPTTARRRRRGMTCTETRGAPLFQGGGNGGGMGKGRRPLETMTQSCK